ncbi:hypothetical protein GCM10009566_10200 [Streptomyces murinus]|uniref:Uncharacterized protein n=1 Tax=Streptomyces murinus TaxID=33900 RepID=A0A7W3NRA3_STRMR|nr:hypothetical protein [Streptomyces murinus]
MGPSPLGILYFHEAMPPERWAGFALVWVALLLLTSSVLHSARRSRKALAALESKVSVGGS